MSYCVVDSSRAPCHEAEVVDNSQESMVPIEHNWDTIGIQSSVVVEMHSWKAYF